MSLQTPTVIRTLQRKLYRKAKERKLLDRRRLRPKLFSVCLTMKPVGEPDAGDRHVRFDERGWETERCRMAEATAPILDSTSPCAPLSSPSIQSARMNPGFAGHRRHPAPRLQRCRNQPFLLLCAPAPTPLNRGDDFHHRLGHVTIPMNSHRLTPPSRRQDGPRLRDMLLRTGSCGVIARR